MREIADSIGAYLFVDMAHVAGLIAAGVYEPGSARSRCHHHHPQNHGRVRGGLIPAKGGDEELYKN